MATGIKLTTTLNLIRSYNPCADGYAKLVRHLGGVKKYGADTPIDLAVILESNGVQDMLWCLRAVPPEQQSLARRFCSWVAADFAAHVLPVYTKYYPNDQRVQDCINGVYQYWRGEITKSELMKLREVTAWEAWEAWAAAVAAERKFQTTRLQEYFNGERQISMAETKE